MGVKKRGSQGRRVAGSQGRRVAGSQGSDLVAGKKESYPTCWRFRLCMGTEVGLVMRGARRSGRFDVSNKPTFAERVIYPPPCHRCPKHEVLAAENCHLVTGVRVD